MPVLLGVAGLLRPEAWLLALAWAAWALPVRRDRAAVVAAALAAPLLWIAFDLAATGDPLHSLHGTQALAAAARAPARAGHCAALDARLSARRADASR